MLQKQIFNKDELTLTQVQKPCCFERPLWEEAIEKELSSLIIANEVFRPIEWKHVLNEKQKKIFKIIQLG